MMLHHLLHRHKTPKPAFIPGMFLGLLGFFVLFLDTRPVLALSGIGVTLIIAGVLVEKNRVEIWDEYRAEYKKRHKFFGLWSEPKQIYYTLNVSFVWPLVILLGILSLYAAYVLSS